MPSVRLVTHCYSGLLPQYAVFLRAQLSSLILFPPKRVKVFITVCCTKEDRRTHAILDEFKPLFGDDLFRHLMPPERLFRRTIGRNAEALSCDTDLIWYTDVDHLFRENCLDSLWAAWEAVEGPKPTIGWPHFCFRHLDQQVGDVYWQKHVDSTGLIDVDEDDFAVYRYRKPIGGTHISPKWFAREHGYLNHPDYDKFMQPETKPFRCFREDQKYRRYCEGIGGGSMHLPIENLYRLRHTAITYPGKQIAANGPEE